MTGRGATVVRLLAEPAPVPGATEAGECPQSVHTLGIVLTAVLLTVINILLAELSWVTGYIINVSFIPLLTLISVFTLTIIWHHILNIYIRS